jgi:hypothetical protein
MKNTVIKILAKRILTLFFILTAFESFGQTYYTYAISDKFRRVGRYRVEKNLVETIADTISAQEAKSIIALNSVRGSNSQSEQNYVQVHDFTLQIEDGQKSKDLKSISDQLTPEMRNELQNTLSGTILTFKEITLTTYDGTKDIPKQMIMFVVR